MEKVVCLVGIGLAEEFLIKRLDFFIFMRFALCLACVLAVKRLCTFLLKIDVGKGGSVNDGSTAAGYTSAGTAHDLDELIILFAALDHIEKILCIAGAVSDSNAYRCAVKVNFSFLDTVGAANTFEFNVIESLAGYYLVNGTESRFHNAAGSAEDDACAGGFAEDGIEIFIGETLEVDTCVLDHSCKLANGENSVNVLKAVSRKLFSFCFELLCGTRHYGYNVDILGIDACLVGVVALDNCAEHFVRRFAGGEVGKEFGIEFFAILDPTGAAACDHGESAAVFESAQKLGAFFHNGEVSREIGIEYLIEAETAECGNELAGNRGTDLHTEFFAEGRSYCGSRLNDDVLGGIVKSRINVCGAVLFVQCADGTSEDTLTAVDAGAVNKTHTEDTADGGVKATLGNADSADLLNLITSRYATAAGDTFGVIANDRGRKLVDRSFGLVAVVGILVNAVFLTKLLKLTVAASYTRGAFAVVVGKNKLKIDLSCLTELFVIGPDLHTLTDGGYAGRLKCTRALDLYKAKTASADFVNVLKIAESRDIDVGFASRFENCIVGRHFNVDAVYGKINFVHLSGLLIS